jgi:hypothetical protein
MSSFVHTDAGSATTRHVAKRVASRVASVSIVLLVALYLASSALAGGNATLVGHHRVRGNVFEYDYIVSTGEGSHHSVGVHRVVQEEEGRPISSDDGVFLTHGDNWNFNAAFLGGSSSSDSLPVFLARKGVDVWGIDFGWTLAPADTTDLSFMRDWGLQRDVDDLEKAIAFARGVRTQTGSAGNRLNLLGWSRGGWISYALLNQESQMPRKQRQVRGFVSVDNFYKTDDAVIRSTMCDFEANVLSEIAVGIYANDNAGLVQIGELAASDPKAISPFFGRPYTNLDVSLTIGAAVFQFGPTFAPFYHFVGGTFPGGDSSVIPDGLTYTTIPRWNSFLASASPFEPARMMAETFAITCGDGQSSFDNHLGDIRVPVLYVGAAGGFGRKGLYSLTLLGSKDVSTNIIGSLRPDKAAFAFGHVDLFTATNAQELVWSPIYRWLSRDRNEEN